MGKRTDGTSSTGNKIIGVRADKTLLRAADKAAKQTGTSRAEFTRNALIQALENMGFSGIKRD